MLKIIGFIFILFSGISLIIIASLSIGIEIDSISYKNTNIEKLYLKYDKKLTISTKQITISDNNSTTSIKLRTNLTVDYANSTFIVDVKKFELLGTDLSLNGLVFIDKNRIDLENKSEIRIENLNLIFDKKMEKVVAEKAFVTYQNKQIDITFEKPFYKDVDLSTSTVSFLVDTNMLKLYLKTTNLFDDTLKNALLRYGVDIPIKQYGGTNDISADIFIPFSKGKLLIESDVKIKNSILESYGQKIDVSKVQLNYKNNQIVLSSTLKDKDNKLFIDFNNTTNLNTKKLNGTINLDYLNQDNNISLKGNSITYDGDFNNLFKLNIHADKIRAIKPQVLDFNNLDIHFEDNIIHTSVLVKDSANIYNLKLLNNTDLNQKTSYGNIKIKNIKYKNLLDLKNRDIPYDLSYKDALSVNIPTFGLTYFKAMDTQTHKLIMTNPKKFFDAFTFITYDNQSSGFIDIESSDLNDTVININDVSFDINSTYFQSEDENITKKIILPLFPKLKLAYLNSNIKYDNYNVSFDTLKLSANKNNLHLTIQENNSTIDITTEDNNLILNANNLTDKYINKLLNKEVLEDGYIDLNIYAEDINFLSGDINFYNTTIKNVTIVNSLTTFINTTPAIVNPLLALPTLFRMAESGFDTNGYYIKHGNGSFQYCLPTQKLQIYDLYTNGKMSNFIVNSYFDLKTKKVEANVDVSFLKDFSTAINYIPVVGYIILGDDGEFHTSVDISGTTENPILETHTVKEGTKGVIRVIKRILTLPLKPFQTESTPEELKEHKKRVDEIFK